MAEATAKTLPAADQPQDNKTERKVSVKLLNDVWIKDPGHPDAGPDGIRRVRTNTLILDAEGKPQMDPKTKNYICKQEIVDLPLSVVKTLLAAGKCERMDPL